MNVTYAADRIRAAAATRGRLSASTSNAGLGVLRSRMTKLTNMITPNSSRPRVHRLVHPSAGPSIRPATSGARENSARPAPHPSNPTSSGPRPPGSVMIPTTRKASRIGTGARKAHRQPNQPTTRPPSTGPRARPSAPADAHTARARGRASGANVIAVIAIAGASIMPAPTPITPRAARRTGSDEASPAATDAAVNNVIPDRNTALRPNRSATAAPGISRLVSATV